MVFLEQYSNIFPQPSTDIASLVAYLMSCEPRPKPSYPSLTDTSSIYPTRIPLLINLGSISNVVVPTTFISSSSSSSSSPRLDQHLVVVVLLLVQRISYVMGLILS